MIILGTRLSIIKELKGYINTVNVINTITAPDKMFKL